MLACGVGRGRFLVKEAEKPEGDFGAKAGFCFIGCNKGIVDTLYLPGPLVFPADFKGVGFIYQKIAFIRGPDRLAGLG